MSQKDGELLEVCMDVFNQAPNQKISYQQKGIARIYQLAAIIDRHLAKASRQEGDHE